MSLIEFISEGVPFQLEDQKQIATWLLSVAKKEQQHIKSITYIFCSDEYLLEINKKYLNHDYYTDIITFDNSIDELEIMADIFISLDRVSENAQEYNVSFDTELNRVIVHGLLHLCGYTDKSEEESLIMRQREDAYISLR